MITDSIRGRVYNYIDGVLDGSIVASKMVIAACKRHLSDLEKQSTEEFPYYFDMPAAQRNCQFFPSVLKHSIGEFAKHPFELSAFQLFCNWCIFGWKRDSDNSRRFRKVYITMGRKNGKSSWIAGMCHYLACGDIDPATGNPEAVAQILLTATKKEQAKVVYSETERMRFQSPALCKMSHVKYETITYKSSGSYIRTVGSNKPFDGLNPHAVIMDELHAWQEQHRPFYDTMVTGSGSRTQPLHIIITTAGDEDSHLWIADHDYAVDVLNNVFRDETLFAFVAQMDEGDNLGDEGLWKKSNPNLGVSVKLEYLKQRWLEDKSTDVGRNRFKRYHGNMLVTSLSKAFDPVSWDKCEGQLSDWNTADAIGAGVDVGSRDDFAAFAVCARFVMNNDGDSPVYRYEAKSFAYIADDTKRDLSKIPFSTWIYCDLLHREKFPVNALYNDLLSQCRQFDIQTVGYDPNNALQLGEDLTREGIVASRIAQNQLNFNEPIRDFQQAIIDGRMLHDGNALLKWCAGNAVIASDRNERYMFDKRSSSDKIDPIVAIVMAFRVASLAPAKFTGSYLIT